MRQLSAFRVLRGPILISAFVMVAQVANASSPLWDAILAEFAVSRTFESGLCARLAIPIKSIIKARLQREYLGLTEADVEQFKQANGQTKSFILGDSRPKVTLETFDGWIEETVFSELIGRTLKPRAYIDRPYDYSQRGARIKIGPIMASVETVANFHSELILRFMTKFAETFGASRDQVNKFLKESLVVMETETFTTRDPIGKLLLEWTGYDHARPESYGNVQFFSGERPTEKLIHLAGYKSKNRSIISYGKKTNDGQWELYIEGTDLAAGYALFKFFQDTPDFQYR